MVIDKKNVSSVVIGNKAANLIQLEKSGISVPPFKVITVKNLILDYDKITLQIEKAFQKEDYQLLKNLIKKIKFIDKNLAEDFRKLKSHHGQLVSFRTSAGNEDLAEYSFAGIYESFLNVELTLENFSKYILVCFASLFSPRVFSYYKKNNISPEKQSFSIVIQKMFPAEVSGVAFSNYPFSNTKMVLTSGLAEKLVLGENAEEYIFYKNNSSKKYPSIIKDVQLKKQFEILLRYLEAITYHRKKPQDIEWSINKKSVAILQTRAITVPIQLAPIQEEVFDCTNISESYPGITTPLTYSFIQYAYSKVYANFMNLVGIKKVIIERNQDTLENLLGYVDGKVYYKINNWYEMIKVFPGYKYNKDFFEAMLVPQKKKVSASKPKLRKTQGLKNLITSLPVLINFGYKLLFYKKDSERFLNNFDKNFSKHKKLNMPELTAKELIYSYRRLEKKFLDKWKVPILNDFRLMIFHGLLDKLLTKTIPKQNKKYLNTLIANFKQDDELKVLKALHALATSITSSKKLNALFDDHPATVIYEKLLITDEPILIKFKKSFDNYVQQYGARRPNELKLESVSVEENPEFIITLLKNFRGINFPGISKNPHHQTLLTIKNVIRKRYNPFQSTFYFQLIKFTAKRTRLAIQLREVFRLRRGMVYSIARDYFLALGDIFVFNDIINKKEDIFYLTKYEIFDIGLYNTLAKKYQAIVATRQKQLLNYKHQDLPKRLKITGLGVKEQILDDAASSDDSLKGLPTTNGIVKGEILVLKEFDPKANYKNKILVTYQTDPGWTVIFPLLKGIVLEKGNTLSHAAILSRELDIPCVVRVDNAVKLLGTHNKILLNGNTGLIITLD